MSVLKRLTQAEEEELLRRLNTSEQELEDDVIRIRQWLLSQYHLPPLDNKKDDVFIKSYLLATKRSLERCKEKIDAYYTIRTHAQELFTDRDPLHPRILKSLSANNVIALPKLTPDGCRVLISTTKDPNPENMDQVAIAKRILSLLDIKLRTEYAYNGDYVVMDSLNFGPGHLIRLRPELIRLAVHLAQEIYPIGFKGLILINSPAIIEITVNRLVKPFLKKKLADRIFIYSEGGSALLKHFPRDILPKDYGGDEESLENLNLAWAKEAERNREWLKEDGKRITNEKKRSCKSKFPNCNSIFGVEGSLRKLNID